MSDAPSLREEVLQGGGLPGHVAVIMDGNGRWARQRHLPRILGHREGKKSVRVVVEAARSLGISHLTLFTFSTENWKRPSAEVKALMGILMEVLREEVDSLQKNGVRLAAMGRLSQLPAEARSALEGAIERLAENQDLVLTLALSYGGRAEIADAARRIAREAAAGELDPEALDEALFERYLYRPDLPPVDLLIRTSGEQRLSNFCLWQLAYSEIHITQTLWPDFSEDDLYRAILDYQGRERRYGR